SIRDSNVSSLITAFVLYWFGSSLVRGFALTLIIGIFISMFSAITLTRTFLKVFVGTRLSTVKTLWRQ
ncbi:MAG: protein translocase subunit SecD, partial [Patescibacteria group bacterium]